MASKKITSKKTTSKEMTSDNMVRAMAGTIVVGSATLAYYTTPAWLLVTGFVGLNLLQSSFTGFCPADTAFKKMGFKPAGAA